LASPSSLIESPLEKLEKQQQKKRFRALQILNLEEKKKEMESSYDKRIEKI